MKRPAGKTREHKDIKLPRSLDETFSITLRVAHQLAESRGITPQHYVREFLPQRFPFPYVPSGLMGDAGLTPDSEEYKALRLWLAEWLYETARSDIGVAHKAKGQRKEAAEKSAAKRRGTGLTKETIQAVAKGLRRPTDKAIAKAMGRGSHEYIRKVRSRA